MIGNPPYGNIILEKKYFIKNYRTVEGKHEIFKYFIEKGLTFLVKHGNLTYITPDTWTSLKNFTKLRKLIYTEYWLKSLSKSLYNVFEVAIVDTNIYFIENSKPSNKYFLVSGDLRSKKESVFQVNDDYIFNIKEENIIIKKVEKTKYRLDDFCEIWQGLIAYGKKGQPRDFTSLEQSSVDHKKLLYGGDIKKYGIKWSGEYLKYGNWLHRPRPAYIFHNPKILVQRIRNPQLKTRLVCALDKQGFLNGTGLSNILVRDKEGKIKLEYILAIINSKLINYWFHYYFTDVNIKPEQLRKIPIVIADKKMLARFEKIVSLLTDIKSSDLSLPTLQLEQEIDILIYKLYDLLYEEVLIIDPGFELIKEDYDKFTVQ